MNKDIRINNFNFPKNRDITEIFKDSELLKPGTYTQFVIVATNIAEASITIDSLGFVIDDGEQKTSYYDYDIRNKKLIKEQIANPNRLQRKGRIGRVKPGTIYYTYLSSRKDFKDLKLKVQYKICIENITTYIINLINNKIETIKEIDETNDPSIIKEKIVNLPDYIKNQYIYNNFKKMGEKKMII
jgi:HrpA-like RNA helicase